MWIDEKTDDREWWDERGELKGVALFTHAQVSLGRIKRTVTASGCFYSDPSAGEIVVEWHDPDYSGVIQ